MMNLITKSPRWTSAALLLLAALWLAGCQSSAPSFAEWSNPGGTAPAVAGTAPANPAIESGPPQQTVATRPELSADLIRPQDTLTITFSDLPEPTPEINIRVKDDGTITLLQNQTFKAAGKTTGELEKEIRESYVPRIYVNMTAVVQKQRESQFFFVGGEVRSPGRQLHIGRITVSKAIQSAGDFTDFAKKSDVLLYRVNAEKPIHINCKKLINNPSLDLEVFPGDRIHVKRSLW